MKRKRRVVFWVVVEVVFVIVRICGLVNIHIIETYIKQQQHIYTYIYYLYNRR